MSKIEKLIAKIENYKSGNKVEFSDLEKYCKRQIGPILK